MMKKLAAFTLALLLMASAAMAPALSEDDQYAVARDRLFDDLTEFVAVSERIWGGNLWMMDSFERYDSERSWESLQTARAALYIRRQDLTECVLPETEMTQDDHFMFMDRGMDFSFMDYNSTMVDNDRLTNIHLCDNLHYFIMLGALMEDDWEICRGKIAFERKLSEYMIRYLAMTADWVVATLDDPEAAAEFDRKLTEKCPMTSAYRSEVKQTPEDIEIALDAMLTEMEGFLADEAAVDGAMEHRLKVMNDIVDTAELSAIREGAVHISGMPPILPYSGWFNDNDISFIWMENGAEVPAPEVGEASLRMPDGWRISMTDVGDPEYREYIRELGSIGVVCTASSGMSYDCEYKGSSFAIIRDMNTVTFEMFGDAPVFVPIWYWYAIRDAGK